jgi:sulfatase maturation enzyme AslB (radical SAM superfamily)
MMQIVELRGCIHVYDLESGRFIKCSAQNVARAVRVQPQKVGREWTPSRKKMIARSRWEQCSNTQCRYCIKKEQEKKQKPEVNIEISHNIARSIVG